MKCIVSLLICFKLTSLVTQQKIPFITSNQDRYDSTQITAANHFEEIVVPEVRAFRDYFLLLKYQGSWRELLKTEKK